VFTPNVTETCEVNLITIFIFI